MVGGRRRGEPGQERRATQDALGEVGVEPDPLPLAGRERPRLLPDGHWDRDPAHVLDQGRASYRRDLVLVEAAAFRRPARQLRHSGGVAGKERAYEVGKVPHRREGAIDPAALEDEARGRLAREGLIPDRHLVVDREDGLGILNEPGGDHRVEGATGPLAHNRGRQLRPAEHALNVDVPSHVGDPHGQRDVLLLLHLGRPLSVPALVDVGEQSPDGGGQPEPLDQHPSNLAAGDVHARHPRARPAEPCAPCGGRERARPPPAPPIAPARRPPPEAHRTTRASGGSSLPRACRRGILRPQVDVGGAADLLEQAPWRGALGAAVSRSTSSRSARRTATSVLRSPCSKSNPMLRSVSRATALR